MLYTTIVTNAKREVHLNPHNSERIPFQPFPTTNQASRIIKPQSNSNNHDLPQYNRARDYKRRAERQCLSA